MAPGRPTMMAFISIQQGAARVFRPHAVNFRADAHRIHACQPYDLCVLCTHAACLVRRESLLVGWSDAQSCCTDAPALALRCYTPLLHHTLVQSIVRHALWSHDQVTDTVEQPQAPLQQKFPHHQLTTTRQKLARWSE